jgi:hypothetical protein
LLQVIVLLTECLHKILEVGLLERIRTLSMVMIVLWKCRACCDKVDDAVKQYEKLHVHENHSKTSPHEMLLQVAMQPGFKQSITLYEKDFTQVRSCTGPVQQAITVLYFTTTLQRGDGGLRKNCPLSVMYLQAQQKLSRDLKTQNHSTGVNGASVADASKLLHQLLEAA